LPLDSGEAHQLFLLPIIHVILKSGGFNNVGNVGVAGRKGCGGQILGGKD
jgi:hypothetical protein